jgi:hypothetical protein
MLRWLAELLEAFDAALDWEGPLDADPIPAAPA